jgi:hypothetical protein
MGGAGLQFAFRVFHLLQVALGARSVSRSTELDSASADYTFANAAGHLVSATAQAKVLRRITWRTRSICARKV